MFPPPSPNILGTQQNCFQTLPLFSITTLCAKCGLQVSHVSVCLYVYVDTSSNRLISSAAGADRGGEATNPALL